MSSQSKSTFPCALSFIFKRVSNKDLLKSGSIGIGCTINKSVTTTTSLAEKTSVFFNKNEVDFPTILDVVSSLTKNKIKVQIESTLPLGFGFGVSAAAALGTAFSINSLLKLKMKKLELITIAHKSEIENGTGLGTVGTQSKTGFILKKTAGIPFRFKRLPFTGKKLYAIIIDSLKSPKILNNQSVLSRVEEEADTALLRIHRSPHISLESILDISYNFVKNSGLLSDERLIKVIQRIHKSNGHATMAILGNVIFTTEKPNFPISFPIQELIIS